MRALSGDASSEPAFALFIGKVPEPLHDGFITEERSRSRSEFNLVLNLLLLIHGTSSLKLPRAEATAIEMAAAAMAVDEVLQLGRNVVVGIAAGLRQRVGDLLRYIARPALGRIERDHADWCVVLAVQQGADDGRSVARFFIGLAPASAEPAEVVEDEVDVAVDDLRDD